MNIITTLIATSLSMANTVPFIADDIYYVYSNRKVDYVITTLNNTSNIYSLDESLSFDLTNNLITEFYIDISFLEDGEVMSSDQLVFMPESSYPLNYYHFLSIDYLLIETSEGINQLKCALELEDYQGFLTNQEYIFEYEFLSDEITFDLTKGHTSYVVNFDDIRKSFYQFGVEEGYNEGYDVGVEEGTAEGYAEGYNEGYNIGYDNGILTGVDIGYENGYSDGFSQGETRGYLDGYNEGYNEGYNIGLEDNTEEFSIFRFLERITATIGNILNVQIFPNITIGTIVFIPIVLKIVEFIVGWFR